MFETLELSFEGELALLAFSTPRGVLPPAVWRELAAALSQLGSARALILTGAGADFSLGLDLKASAPVFAETRGKAGAFMGLVREMQAAVELLANLPILTIAAVNGWCIGAGLELACACDLRLASAGARFSLPEVKLGLVADLGGLQRLPRLIGEGPARWLALTGEAMSAQDALRLGLLGEVFDTPEALGERAKALARTVAAYPARAVQGSKRVLNERLPHAEGLLLAARWNAEHLDLAALSGALGSRKAADSGKSDFREAGFGNPEPGRITAPTPGAPEPDAPLLSERPPHPSEPGGLGRHAAPSPGARTDKEPS